MKEEDSYCGYSTTHWIDFKGCEHCVLKRSKERRNICGSIEYIAYQRWVQMQFEKFLHGGKSLKEIYQEKGMRWW